MRFVPLIQTLCFLSVLFAAYPTQANVFEVGNRDQRWNSGQVDQTDEFLDKIQPVLNRRCVACHGCSEAPCQLNMQSYEGIRRGFNPEPIFSSKRKTEMLNTRMNDRVPLSHWRSIGFIPVVGHDSEPNASDKATAWQKSLFHQFLDLGQQSSDNFDPKPLLEVQDLFKDDIRYECVATEDQYNQHFKRGRIQTVLTKKRDNPWDVARFADYAAKYENGGMPFAVARLHKESEHDVLVDWLSKGALGPTKEAQAILARPSKENIIKLWEMFFNLSNPKAQHAARYIYEHVYSATWVFDEMPGEFFQMIRVEPNGKEMITDFPYENPNQIRFEYKLVKITNAIVHKKLILWPVSLGKLKHLKALFLDSAWGENVAAPVYGSNNPFEYFAPIPARLRTQFMMENSHVIAGAMVQGSVCVGSRATYAIKDHFWVWFLKPEADPSVQNPDLDLPSWNELNTARVTSDLDDAGLWEQVSQIGVIDTLKSKFLNSNEKTIAMQHFVRTAKANKIYSQAWEEQLRMLLKKQNRVGLSLDDIWHGGTINPDIATDAYFAENANPNAWINILRHSRSATVHYGPHGGQPQSIWVLSYSNFEHLYYNLVANYKEFGSLTHKLATWRHMSYVRLEAEDLAISLLPESVRADVRAEFTKGVGAFKHKAFFPMRSEGRPAETKIRGRNGKVVVQSLVKDMTSRLRASAGMHHGGSLGVDRSEPTDTLKRLQKLGIKSSPFPQYFPDISYLRVKNQASGQSEVYTLVADRAYEAHNVVFFENLNRDEKADTISVFEGVVGAFPNIFLEMNQTDVESFVSAARNMQSSEDWEALRSLYGVRRTSPEFWETFDWFHDWKAQKNVANDPREQGISDLSLYEMY